jgi:hypothetical protein
MLATILGLIQGFLQAIPILNRWFTKPTESKVEDAAVKARNELDEFKKTGRPGS